MINCPWCDVRVKLEISHCPECGLQHPGAGVEAEDRHRIFRRPATFALVFLIGIMGLTGGGWRRIVVLTLDMAPNSPVTAISPVIPTFRDSLQRSVWLSGQDALRLTLKDPKYSGFTKSFIVVSAGQVISLCGEVDGTSGFYGADGQERYVSVSGQPNETVLESQDISFAVLWDRVCSRR
jgi:hypothetical protein